jgi:hypothetical protein
LLAITMLPRPNRCGTGGCCDAVASMLCLVSASTD